MNIKGSKNNQFIPPKEVANAANKGLMLKEQFGLGGTEVGWDRAEQLKERKAIGVEDVKKISSYFARHEIDKKAENFGNDNDPSAGYVAWLLWGGDAGKKWIEEVKKELDKQKD